MNKKSTSKFSKIFTNNLVQKSKIILLAIILASLFLPVYGVDKVYSQGAGVTGETGGPRGTPPPPQQQPSNTVKVDDACSLSSVTNAVVESNKDKVGTDEKFDLYVKFEIDAKVGAACEASGKNSVVFSPYFYYGTCGAGEYLNYQRSYEATFFNESGKYGFHARISGLTVKDYASDSIQPYQKDYCIYSYYHKNGETPVSYLSSYAKIQHDATSSSNTTKSSFPSSTVPKPPTTAAKLVLNNAQSVDGTKLGIKFIDKDGKGLRSKYRMSMADKTAMEFGKANGLDPIIIDWSDTSPKLVANQFITLSKENDSAGIYNNDPNYQFTNIAFTYGDSKWDGTKACAGASLGNQTCEVLFYEKSLTNLQRGNWDTNAISKVLVNSPVSLNPSIKPLAWQKDEFKGKKSVDGAPVGSVDFLAVPMIWATGGYSGSGSVYIMGQTPPKFTIEVFENETQIIEACKKENSGNESICTAEYSRYGIGKVLEQSTQSSSTNAETTAAGELFSFLRKIIAYIVLLLTSFIYWIFATILVPVLVALIQVHPYKDEFVNFVYPGWIIVRNISNIAFIVALLYMGLKILFQQEDASKSRGFIVTLILMALLVNFSLVIGQGIVAIADTVQSQFLPEDSKVIETLGHKLMVDPIIIFRGDDDSLASGGNFTADASASDLPKAIVMLVLAIAAFFSFVALAAFMFVRLVALWILYMVSPFAYVARILPEAKSYSTQWWNNFLKYAFAVPILAFFLNIAALIAVTFSAQSGDQVQVEGARGYVFGTAAAGITEFALTTVSHFIVLFFIFAGMKVALSIGGAGAKQIVDAAKKGFDWTTRTAPRLATDFAADKLSETKFAKSRPNLQRAIRSVARPITAIKAVKKGYLDEPHKEMNKRFDKSFGDMSNRIQPYGEDKAFPVKWLAWKISGRDTKSLLNKAKNLQDESSIFTATELANKTADLATNTTNNTEYSSQLSDFTTKDQIRTTIGRNFVDRMLKSEAGLQRDVDDIDDQLLSTTISAGTRTRLTAERTKKQAELTRLQGNRTNVESRVVSAETSGDLNFDISGIHADLAPVVDLKEFEKDLQTSIDDTGQKILDVTEELKNNTAKRTKYNRSTMDDKTRKDLLEKAQSLTATAQSRERPVSTAVETQEAEAAKEEQKKLVDLDYDQLSAGLEKALKNNNTASARAHLKQLSDNGDLKDLLEAKGKKNNVEDLADLVKQSFGKSTNRTQVAIIRELSNSSAKNGNNALAKAVQSLAGGGGMLRDIKSQQAELVKGKVKNIYESKKSDLTFTDKDGKEKFNNGVKGMIDSYNTEEKAKKVKQDLDKKTADHILKTAKANNIKLGVHIEAALKDVQAKP